MIKTARKGANWHEVWEFRFRNKEKKSVKRFDSWKKPQASVDNDYAANK